MTTIKAQSPEYPLGLPESSTRTEFCLEVQYTWAPDWFRREEVLLGIGHARLCMGTVLNEPHTRAARIIQRDVQETVRHEFIKPQA